MHIPVVIADEDVEMVSSLMFLGTIITDELSWSAHILGLVEKAQQRLFFLRRPKKAGMWKEILLDFYRGAIESILTYNATLWQDMCTAMDIRVMQRVIMLLRACNNLRDITSLSIKMLLLGKCYRSIGACPNRLQKLFFPRVQLSNLVS